MVPSGQIVCIFDMDTATASKHTRKFLSRMEQEGRIVSVADELPKSGVLCQSALGEMLYISPISPQTLTKRAQSRKIRF
jgi:hypothetical protein